MYKALFLCVAGAVLLPSAILAAVPTEIRSERVSYADLNILTPGGQKILDRRLVNAAHSVCDPVVQSDPFEVLAALRCMKRALADARVRMDQAVALEQTRRPAATLLASR